MIIEGQIYSIWLEHAYTHTQYSHMFDLHISSICMFRCCLESYCYLRVSTASSVVFDMCVQCDFCTILIISLVFACVKPTTLGVYHEIRCIRCSITAISFVQIRIYQWIDGISIDVIKHQVWRHKYQESNRLYAFMLFSNRRTMALAVPWIASV